MQTKRFYNTINRSEGWFPLLVPSKDENDTNKKYNPSLFEDENGYKIRNLIEERSVLVSCEHNHNGNIIRRYKFFETSIKFSDMILARYLNDTNNQNTMKFDSKLDAISMLRTGIYKNNDFHDIETFNDYISDNIYLGMNFNEIIQGKRRQKPHFDIDISLEEASKLFDTIEYPEEEIEQIVKNFISNSKFDYEVDLDTMIRDYKLQYIADKILNEFLSILVRKMTDEYPDFRLDEDLLIFSSNSYNKKSYHIVVNSFYHMTNLDARAFYDLITYEMDPTFRKFVDRQVYSSIQSFRTALSYKASSSEYRIKKLMLEFKIDGETYYHNGIYNKLKNHIIRFHGPSEDEINRMEDGMLDMYDIDRQIVYIRELFRMSLVTVKNDDKWIQMNSYYTKPEKDLNRKDISDDMVKDAIEHLNKYFDGNTPFEYDGCDDGFIKLKRIRPSYCQVCDRTHDKVDSYLKLYKSTLYLNCRRTTQSTPIHHYKDEDIKIPEEHMSIVRKLNQNNIQNETKGEEILCDNPIVFDDRIVDINDRIQGKLSNNTEPNTKPKSDNKPEDIDTRESKLVYDPQCVYDINNSIVNNTVNDMLEVNLRYISEYFTDRDQYRNKDIYIRSTFGTGKSYLNTKLIKEFINDNPDNYNIIFMSSRKTLTSKILDDLKEFKPISYTDVTEYDSSKHLVYVSQIDSISKISIDSFNDRKVLLILDEIVSILSHVLSSPKLDIPYLSMLKCLITKSENLICSDNDLTSVIINQILSIRSKESIKLNNTYRPYTDVNGKIYGGNHASMVAYLEKILYPSIKERNKPSIVCCHSKKVAKQIHLKLSNEYGDDMVKLYTSETSDQEKFDDMVNIDDKWSKCRAIIFTSCIQIGIDANHEDLDTVFCLFNQDNASYMSSIQMIFRTRKIKNLSIFVNTYSDSHIRTEYKDLLEDMISSHSSISRIPKIFRWSCNPIFQMYDPEIKDDRDSLIKSLNSFEGKIWMSNNIISKRSNKWFISYLYKQLKSIGINIDFDGKYEFMDDIEKSKLKDSLVEYKDNGKIIEENDIEMLSNFINIDPPDEDTKLKSIKTRDEKLHIRADYIKNTFKIKDKEIPNPSQWLKDYLPYIDKYKNYRDLFNVNKLTDSTKLRLHSNSELSSYIHAIIKMLDIDLSKDTKIPLSKLTNISDEGLDLFKELCYNKKRILGYSGISQYNKYIDSLSDDSKKSWTYLYKCLSSYLIQAGIVLKKSGRNKTEIRKNNIDGFDVKLEWEMIDGSYPCPQRIDPENLYTYLEAVEMSEHKILDGDSTTNFL